MKSSTETVLWAGSIVRYHNRPTAQRQTVGEHTWRVLIIYTELYGMPRPEIYQRIIYHDVPEVVTGDIPFMAKRRWPDLKYLVATKEFDAEELLGIDNQPEVTKEEGKQIKTADLLEMLFFAVDDVQMGCQYSIDIIVNILEALDHDKDIKTYLVRSGYQDAINRILNTREGERARSYSGQCENNTSNDENSV